MSRGRLGLVGPDEPREGDGMTEESVHGPVDFVLIEFPDDQLTGRAAAEVMDLIRRGIIRVYDVLVVGKDRPVRPTRLDLAEVAAEQPRRLPGRWPGPDGLLGEDDLAEAATSWSRDGWRRCSSTRTPGRCRSWRRPASPAASWWPVPASPRRT